MGRLLNFCQIGLKAIVGGLTCAGALSVAAGAPLSPADDAEGRAALAERISELGENGARLGGMTEPAFRESAALLEAAGRINPHESRFPRLLASADSQLQDVDGQIAAWIAYRKIVPDDREAQQELIDLYAAKVETADGKLAYLRGLLDNSRIPEEVRAHIAAECVPLLLDRSRDQAIEMAARAKKLYPLPEVLRWEYELVGKQAVPLERVKSLLGLIKANPSQTQRVAELAHLLASNGLPDASLEWYAIALNLDNRTATSPSHELALEYACELYIAGEAQAAESVVGRLLQVQPDDPDFWFLKLTLQRGLGEQVALSQTLGLARDAFVRRLAFVNNQILGKAANASTQPAIVEAPDPAAALASLKGQDRSEYRNDFVWALGNLAWFELYFDQQTEAAAPWIEALKALLPADDVTLQRLQGWRQLMAGHAQDVRAVLAPLAERDALSALGMIRIDSADKDPSRSAELATLKAKLLAENLTGLLGAVLREGFIETSATTQPAATQPATTQATTSRPTEAQGASRVEPTTSPATTAPAVATPGTTAPTTSDPATAQIRAALGKFPKDWLGVLDQPQRFYTLRAEPLRTAVHFGEPFYVRVTLKNVANYDLFIGPEGLLQPHLWFNAQLHGIVTQQFPGVVYDRIANDTVLRPNATTTQTIRFDQGELGEAMRQRPNGSIIVTGNVLTNPITLAGGVAVGPGGYGMQFTKNYVRLPTDLRSANVSKRIDDELADGSPSEKLRDLELVASYLSALGKEMDQAARASGGVYLQRLTKSRGDPVPEVSEWAQYLLASLPGVEGQEKMIIEMLASKDWQVRLLGLAALRGQHAEVQQQQAVGLAEGDSDPVVKRFAGAVLDALKHPSTLPSSRPTAPTQPAATEPAGPALPPTDVK